jgi:hypothetical protein
LADVAHDLLRGRTLLLDSGSDARRHAADLLDAAGVVDITPRAAGERRILFLPDPERTFDFDTRRRLINIKRSLGLFPEAQVWIDANDRAQRFLEANSIGAGIRMDPKAFLKVAADVSVAQARLTRAFSATGKPTLHQKPNERCACGSTRKFKKCCDPRYQMRA